MGKVWKEKREIVWALSGGVCFYCRITLDPEDWTVDHFIPLGRGGSHAVKNLRVACEPCNNAAPGVPIVRHALGVSSRKPA